MIKIAAYRVADGAAFILRPLCGAVRNSLTLSPASLGVGLLTVILSQAGAAQAVATAPAFLSSAAETARTAISRDQIGSRTAARRLSDSGDTVLLAEAEGPFSIGGGGVRIPLRPASATASGEGPLVSRLNALKRGRNIYLVLRGLHADVQPGVLYNVYLDLPAGAKPEQNDPHYVGLLNFFNSAYEGSADKSDFFLSYDITSVAKKLCARKLLGEHTTVTISPANTPEGNPAPTINRVEVVEQ